MSRVKIAEEIVFLFFFSEFSSDFERKNFQTFGHKTSNICQNYLLRVQRNNMWLQKILKNFEPFWIFCRNLWHGSQNSIYVSRVKVAEEIVFLFFFQNFLRNLSENFSDFWPKNFKKLSKLTSVRAHEQFLASRTFKSFEPFWIFCINPWHGSQNSINVSRVKVAEKYFFLFFFSDFFFGCWAKKISDFWPKNFKKSSKLPFACPEEQFVAWTFFNVLNRFGFAAETFGVVLKFLSTFPE